LADWRIISRETNPEDSVITVRGTAFGGGRMLNIAVSPDDCRADALYLDPFYLPDNPYAECGMPSEKEQIRLLRQTLSDSHAAGRPVLVRIRDVRQIRQVLEAEAGILYLGRRVVQHDDQREARPSTLQLPDRAA